MLQTEQIRTVMCGAYQENAYLVCPDGRTDAFIVDPGDDLDRLRRALDDSGRTLAAILLTHGHFDHTLAAEPLQKQTGAPVYVHPADAQMLRDADRCAWDPTICRLPLPSGAVVTAYPDTLSVCGETLRVLATPGHSQGSVCLYEPEGGILFSGDTLFRAGYGRTDLFGGSDADMVHSLISLLKTLPEDTRVYSGHGAPTTIGLERGRYRL